MQLHHLGIVVSDLEKTARLYKETYSDIDKSQTVYDQSQKAKICFLYKKGFSFSWELIEPIEKSSPVNNFLLKGGGLHHQCYEVDNIENQFYKMRRTAHAMLACGPISAAAFNNRIVLFLVMPDHTLIELLQKETYSRLDN